jgi:archaeal flagellar protein FlaJ
MSKKLIKLSHRLVELSDEAIKIQKTEKFPYQSKKKYHSIELNEIISEIRKSVSDYSTELRDVSKEHKEKQVKVKVRSKEIKEFVKSQKLKSKKQEYDVYKTNFYSKLSNFFMEDFSFMLAKKYPDQFGKLSEELTQANIKILSKTYLSILLFSTIITFPILTILVFIFTINIFIALFSGIMGAILLFLFIYKYPGYEKSTRSKSMKNELVFALIHMSAIASSGTQPIKIFKLLLDSGEYKYLKPEFERIINYINIFGYNLTTSLKAVAKTTPSPDFKEFLHGMSSTIESGGGIQQYLKSKVDDHLVKYKLEQEKHLEVISTYSEIYTGILIAAPLLFIVLLAILERISPELGGIPISVISQLSVFLVLPLLNIIFILFLEASKSGK